MIFKSIKLKNFRQYKEEIKIDFSQPDNEGNNITLLVADNGVGKTTFLQSIRYCFFGSNSNYLRLPNKKDLINFNLVNEINQLDQASMYVEVEFTHENTTFIARREEKFEKRGDRLYTIEEEKFSLKQSTGLKGFKIIDEAMAMDKMRSIMPEGLSYIFMFDGERMERNISDRQFRDDLKESILGILNIKQYDELISLLGNKGQSTSVIGRINGRKSGQTQDEISLINKNRRLEELKEERLGQLEEVNEKIKNYNIEINTLKEKQRKYAKLEKEQALNEKYISEFRNIEQTIEEKSKQYVLKAIPFYKDKLLKNYRRKYKEFNKKASNEDFVYRNLHVNTLEDILISQTCLCGEKIGAYDEKIKRINELKKFALPFEIAHHLNLLDQKFNQASDTKDDSEQLEQLTKEIEQLKKDEYNKNIQISKQKEKMANIESEYNVDYNKRISKLEYSRDKALKENGSYEKDLERIDNQIKKISSEVEKIDASNKKNRKINDVLEELEQIKNKLEAERNGQNIKARKTLEYHLQEILSKVLQGRYKADIDEDYNITIYDNNGNDVTPVLSTGQNVVVSVSLISALIKTAQKLSDDMSTDEEYGIIMDSALSNLDSIHISRLTKYNLINMDQLIFLTFKKQLRDEMINGIIDNVGKAYELKLDETNNSVIKSNLKLENLVEYISRSEDE